jgi:D-serine deaminase-like pyridoxal phosphate-dependent protein
MSARQPGHLDEVDTPFLAVDLDVFEENVAACFGRLRHVDVRPHQKTAKSPDVARRLLDAGASGICVAKLSEAEVMLEAGIDDLLITTEIAGRVKVARLVAVLDRFPDAPLRLVVDSARAADAIDAALPRPVDVLIEVDVGQNRCGVAPEDARALADHLATLPQLRLIGVQGYEGNLQHVRDSTERRARCDCAMGRLEQAVGALRAGGHRIDVVTSGGTGTAEFCAAHEVVTEVQPGSFIFMDADYGDTAGVPYRTALLAHATVISHPTPSRAVVDAGLKALSDDSGRARLSPDLGWTYEHGGDEHGVLTPAADDPASLRIGDRVSVQPSHIDTTINLHDVIYAHRGGVIEQRWEVAARGKTQ